MSQARAFILQVMHPRTKGAGPSLMRALLWALSIPYFCVLRARNELYDRRWLTTRRLPASTISIGNLTTGGTGKTPVAIWLTNSLLREGRKPAILLRGYKSVAGLSDEQQLLANALPRVPVVANADRLQGAATATKSQPGTDVFILDDGFQHRKVRRQFDLILINATQPFGFGYVLPRGLLREPLAGLRRAHAILITHTSEADSAALPRIEKEIGRLSPEAAFWCDHVQETLASDQQPVGWDDLKGKPYAVACAIGDPESFIQQLALRLGPPQATFVFSDHHSYTTADVERMLIDSSGLAAILTTSKDWVKLGRLPLATRSRPPFVRVEMAIRFRDDDERRLLDLIHHHLNTGSA